MRRNHKVMGTGASLDIPAAKNEKIFGKVFALLDEIDRQLSPYKKDSELSRYQRDEIKLSSEMRAIKKACEKYEKLTNGYFSANFAGEFDPTGYVKGWAIARAGKLIEKKGHKTFCISIGGDVLARSDGDKVWTIGIQNPIKKSEILNLLSISNGAVATSGSYERGQHIINPHSGKAAEELISVTVTGPDIIPADVLATALFARGKTDELMLEQFRGYEVSTIARKVVGLNVFEADAKIQ